MGTAKVRRSLVRTLTAQVSTNILNERRPVVLSSTPLVYRACCPGQSDTLVLRDMANERQSTKEQIQISPLLCCARCLGQSMTLVLWDMANQRLSTNQQIQIFIRRARCDRQSRSLMLKEMANDLLTTFLGQSPCGITTC